MSDLGKQSSISNRSMNPWVLHLQKLGLELKCPLCLNLFKRPLLLQCDHLFCDPCIVRLTEFGSECPICKSQSADRDGVDKNDKSDKCIMQRCGKDKGYETPDKGGVEYDNAGKVDLL
ncbi:hypothetical protein CRYUN_Cryun01aG0156500 [Craigia yunnanensis]